ncbi:MAG TPA: FAD/NAD(P)-binding protein [Iamia sp.]|nr:FAD/NAD(P)-binding protein [Iamia sp.]
MRDQVDIAIVGAGAAGTLLADALRRCRSGATVAVIGAGHPPGRGVAYSTTDEQHRMNVPVKRLSVDADGSDHLARWSGADPSEYIPRATYGAYLAEQLAASGADVIDARVTTLHPPPRAGDRMRREAVGSDRQLRVGLGDGRVVRAGQVVLATGPPPGPGPVALPDHPRVLADPWAPELAERAGAAGDVLVLGTGLTMVDVALTATAAGASVTALSRHGWVPRAHPVHREEPIEPFPLPPGPLTAARVRRMVVVQGRTEPAGWPAAMDAARDRADDLWARLPEAEQAKLLRRGLSAWTVHRHRMAPAVAERFSSLARRGLIRVERGTIASVTADDGGVDVRTRDGRCRRAGLVVSCTGPSADVGRTTDPLLRHLLDTGIAALGPHRLGLAVDPCGRVRGPDGEVVPGLFTLGLLRKGTLFETTAVPEIRAQAQALAPLLSREVSPGGPSPG